MSLIILSDTTMFLYRRLMKDEQELKDLERKLLFEQIHEENLRELWIALDMNEFEKEAKTAHFIWTTKQHEVAALEHRVEIVRQRLVANAFKKD